MKELLYGSAYYSEYLPYDRIEKDMDMMKKAGFNVIRIAESTWSTLEPFEGEFDFTHIDMMIECAKRHNIKVIVGTPTYAVPTWLVKKYPDILATTHNGKELYGHRQNMDITNKDYLRHSEIIIRKLMDHIKGNENIIGFQLDNETKSYDTCSVHAQEMFVSYLQEKYPDIKDFNTAFGLDYWSNRVNSWEDFPDVRGTINQSLDAEYKKFQRRLVTDFLSWQASIVREYASPSQFVTHNFDYQWINYSYGYQPEVNQYDAVKCMDIAGCDIYHPSQGNLTGAEITFDGNITRSLLNKNYLILETQAQGLPQMLPFEGQLRLQAFSHIANGANSILYWHWHSIHNAIESYWKGVVSHNFEKGPAYNEICSIGEDFKKLSKHIINLKKENKVAIMLDNNSLTGLQEFPLETTKELSYNKIARWIGDALYRLNIEYDMICSSARDFSKYDVLIVPGLYSASENLLYDIEKYVENGGNLIATFKTGFSDENIKIYHDTQPHILHKCLGINYDQFTYPKDVTINYNGKSSSAREWIEMVNCDTATSLINYQHYSWNKYSAVTINKYKKGHALYIATLFDDNLLEDVLTDFINSLNNSHIYIDKNTAHFPIIIKKGINDYGKKICYYFNYSDTIQSVIHNESRGINLLNNTTLLKGSIITLKPWGFAIVEI